jgi:endoglycosylceramidase
MRVTVAALLLLSACSVPEPKGWHVAGGFIRDPDGRAALLRGINLSGEHKQKPYFSFHTEADMVHARNAWGLAAFRFLVEWAAVEPQRGVYDAAYLDQVAARVGAAERAGFQVIIDMHQDVYGEGFIGFNGAPRWTCDQARYDAFRPRDPWFASYLDENVLACVDGFYASSDLQDHYVEAWRRVAARLAGSPAVIGFDPMNEPHWGSYSIFDFEAERLQPFYTKVVTAVRGEAPGWLAFLEPSSSRNVGIPTGLTKPTFGGVVYAPHGYDNGAEGSGTFDPARRQAIIDNLRKLREEATALDAALWIGEYGGVPGGAGYPTYMDAAYEGAGDVGAAGAYWDWSRQDGGYSAQFADGRDKPDALDILARPWPERVAGAPLSYTFERTTRIFRFTWSPVAGTTEIAVPAHFYPTGFTVECGGCTVEKSPGRVRVLEGGGAITLHPL